jgi:hypothetical protein
VTEYTPLTRELYKNPLIKYIISGNIVEYDIAHAHTSAIYYIKGKEVYEQLMKMTKKDRNIQIGKWQINNKELVNELQRYLYLFKKKFIEENNIKNSNIVETTKDSLLITNKIPTKTIINIDGLDIEFNNKEGAYSSYYRINGKSLLYDNMTGNIRIKGIDKEIVDSSPFVKKYMLPLLTGLENSISLGPTYGINLMKTFRLNYIKNDNPEIYRSLDHKNKYLYNYNNEIIESDLLLDEGELIIVNNYTTYVMPLMRSIL